MTKHISRRTALRGIATIAVASGATAALASPEAPEVIPATPAASTALVETPDQKVNRLCIEYMRAISERIAARSAQS